MKYETLHICTAADHNFVLPLGAFVSSVIQNCTSNKCVIHVMETNIPQKTQNKLKKLCHGTNIGLEFINMAEYKFDFQGLSMKHWTNAIFYRIMIPEIFQHLDRIIYIDCDTLVLKDLHDLYNIELPDDKFVAMVSDKYSFLHRREYLKLTSYYNSGMIVFDTARCRRFDFRQKSIQWIHDFPQYAKYPDQDAINVVLQDHILRLENIYNWQIVPDKGHFFKRHTDTIHIIHFLTEKKPWLAKTHPVLCWLYTHYVPYTYDRLKIIIKHYAYRIQRFVWEVSITVELHKGTAHKFKRFKFCKITVFTKRVPIDQTEVLDYLKSLKDKMENAKKTAHSNS